MSSSCWRVAKHLRNIERHGSQEAWRGMCVREAGLGQLLQHHIDLSPIPPHLQCLGGCVESVRPPVRRDLDRGGVS